MKNQATGFTLIELMVVIAIIAVLAAIAIPQYNDYAARGQLSEAIALLGGMKAPVAEQFANDDTASSCSLPLDAVTSGKYVAAIAAPAATPCVITATFRSTGVSSKINSQNVIITYTASTGVWACETSAPVEVAPKGCPHR